MNASFSRNLLATVVAAAVSAVLVTDAWAQERDRRSASNSRVAAERAQAEEEQAAAKETRYPEATREEPAAQGSAKLRRQLNETISVYNEGNYAQARANADAILAAADANGYDIAVAAQVAAHSAYELDDEAAAVAYLRKAVAADALENNAHFGAMLMLAQLQIQQGDDEAGLATLDSFLEQTRSAEPAHLVLKANTLFALERHEEAAATARAAIEAAEDPDPSWMQMLLAIYVELDRPDEAARIVEQLVERNPDDLTMQFNLATIYRDAGRDKDAIAVLDKLRASNRLTEERHYRHLYTAYANMDGREQDTIAVIEEGLAKGLLAADHQTYVALAQSYYFSDNDTKAIENYRKAAPLAEDGETYLNLARVLWNADRIPEAKQAAELALDKGLARPEEARKILALPN